MVVRNNMLEIVKTAEMPWSTITQTRKEDTADNLFNFNNP